MPPSSTSQETSLSYGHQICVAVDKDKRKVERKKKKSTICAIRCCSPRCPPGTCGNPVRSAFDHLVDSRASLPLTYPRKSLPLKITQRAEQTLMPVVNCLKAPGRGALGNRLWNLFSAPLLPPLTALDPEAVPLRSCHMKSLW